MEANEETHQPRHQNLGQVVYKPILLVSPVVFFLPYSLPKARLEHILIASVGRGTSFLVMAG